MRHAREQPLLQPVAQGRNTRRILGQRLPGKLRSSAHADNASYVFRARAKSSLVVPAVEKLLQARATADVQRSDPLRRIKLVPGERQQIHAQRVDVDRELPCGLHRVGMKVHVGVSGDAADFLKWLHRAQLVVGVHHGNQRGFLAKSAAQRLWRNDSLPVDGQVGDRYTLLLKRLARVEHSFVFDVGGDDVFEVSDGKAFIGIIAEVCSPTGGPGYKRGQNAKDRVVVSFRAAAGEDDFLRTRANQRRDLFARSFNRAARLLPKGVNRGGIAELPRQVGQHSVEHRRLDSRGGIVIQIDAIHGRAIRIDSTSRNGKPAMLPSSERRCVPAYRTCREVRTLKRHEAAQAKSDGSIAFRFTGLLASALIQLAKTVEQRLNAGINRKVAGKLYGGSVVKINIGPMIFALEMERLLRGSGMVSSRDKLSGVAGVGFAPQGIKHAAGAGLGREIPRIGDLLSIPLKDSRVAVFVVELDDMRSGGSG